MTEIGPAENRSHISDICAMNYFVPVVLENLVLGCYWSATDFNLSSYKFTTTIPTKLGRHNPIAKLSPVVILEILLIFGKCFFKFPCGKTYYMYLSYRCNIMGNWSETEGNKSHRKWINCVTSNFMLSMTLPLAFLMPNSDLVLILGIGGPIDMKPKLSRKDVRPTMSSWAMPLPLDLQGESLKRSYPRKMMIEYWKPCTLEIGRSIDRDWEIVNR